jgi:TPR repeat protein
MQDGFPVTTGAAKRQLSLTPAQLHRNWLRFALLAVAALVLLGIVFFCARWWFAAAPPLQAHDLLLLTPDAVTRVEAAAKAGDILAESTLGAAYLDGNGYIAKDVTQGVHWLRKVADRDSSEYEQIQTRMQSLVEQRRYEFDPQKRREIDIEYLDLVSKKLSFEAAFLGLIQVYVGGHGNSHADVELALKYMRLGANYGFPSSQRTLGIVTALGLLGVPKNEIAGTILLSDAAAQGDRVAQRWLADLHAYQDAMLRARMRPAFLDYSFS